MRVDGTGRTLIDVRGPTQVLAPTGPVALRPKERAVLAAIALIHPEAAGPDRIADLVWGADPPATARQSIQNHVARIRQAAGDVVATTPTGYVLADTVEARPWVDGAGEPYADLADTPEVAAARTRALALAESELDTRLTTAVREDEPEAVARLTEATAAQPFNEHRWLLLAVALTRRGQRREALAALAAARGHLADAGLLPGAELRQLESWILDPALTAGDVTDRALAAVGAAPRSAPAPAARFHPHRDDPFVGRSKELAELHRSWQAVLATGAPRLVIVEGPAGVGKTRLTDRFVAGLDGVRVLHGRNRQSADLPHAVLVESLAPIVATEAGPRVQTDTALAGLARLFPEHRPLGHAPEVAPFDGDTRLARSVRALVEQVLAGPTVWCLDDLQWSAPETLAILETVLDGLANPLLVVVTVRHSSGGVADLLARLMALVPTTVVRPGPLSASDVGELIGRFAVGDTDLGGVDAERVRARTGGLALYVSELARVARHVGVPVDPDAVPSAIREWITLRVSALDPDTRSVLELAAVIGEEADVAVLATAGGPDPTDVARRCDALVAAGLLLGDRPMEGRPAVVRFAHTLTHEVVYSLIGPGSLPAHHFAVAEALAANATRFGRPPSHAELARHYGAAGTAGQGPAAEHALLAGHEAFRAGAWTDAARHFRLACDLTDDPIARAERLVALGLAELRAEHFGPAEQALRAARDLARLHGLALVHADAVLGLVGRAGRGAAIDASDEERLELLRTAIRHVDRSPPSEADQRRWALVMSDLERELAFTMLLVDNPGERTRLLERAVERLRALEPPDPAALARVLLGSRYAKLAPDRLVDRLADTAEVLQLGPQAVGQENLLAAYCYRAEDLLRAGRYTEAEDALEDAEFVARRYPDPYWTWALSGWRVVTAIIAGDLDAAEDVALRTAAMRPGVAEAAAAFAVNLATIRLYQGRPEELIDPLQASAARHPEIPLYRAVLAQALAQDGRHAEAGEILAAFADRDFAALPHDTNRFIGLVTLGHVAADVGDVAAAARLSELLAPYGAQWSLVNVYGAGGGTWGPAVHACARLAALLGDVTLADRLFHRALALTADAPVERARVEAHRAATRVRK